ncbi:MAG: hypothetical protein Q8N79_01840 [Candidatus Methanoperedens sp.]|nr:hypothetical protein [Candidatus Methanoperedens sp.]
MPLFKLDFMNTMEGCVEMASSGQQTLDMFSGSYPDVDKLEDAFMASAVYLEG